MNNKMLIGGIVVLILIGGVWYFSQNKYQPVQTQPAVQEPRNQEPLTTVETNTVTIQNFSFNPAILTVPVGTTVTWINKDSAPHTIKSETFTSSTLNQGDLFEFTFNTTGSFDYTCGIHPSMSGKIVVE